MTGHELHLTPTAIVQPVGLLNTRTVKGRGLGCGAALYSELGLRDHPRALGRRLWTEKGGFVQLLEAPAAWDGPLVRRVVIDIECPGHRGVGGHVMISNVNNCQRAVLYSNGLK